MLLTNLPDNSWTNFIMSRNRTLSSSDCIPINRVAASFLLNFTAIRTKVTNEVSAFHLNYLSLVIL